MNVYETAKPFQSNAERLQSEALAASQVPGAVLQQEVRPPLPQIIKFPPRYGYGDMQDRQASLEQVLDAARLYNDARREVSGGPGPDGYQGSSRNVNSDGGW